MSSEKVSASIIPADTELLTVVEYAQRLGVAVTRVFDMLGEHRLICVYDGAIKKIPADFLSAKGTTNKFVPGLIALLSDGGYTDTEIFTYLYTDDDSLPGRPIDALHGHLAREVMRRAQAMGL
ncbi:Rv2175c family DNA-binding protein [Corynebacterium sp. ES2794-CONJ1]|uniref:Rv2175c family DNA-binding protein n=1 Tax=unclassified Corynebacterium TaxID=2624378 RepID=UPI002167E4D0|nr:MULTISPECIES: Rv2175c family DNA-binding protein [unclassified Corynebacterium]MCS4489000.1 Rv2175c family DNA-binding protein [Corynebacterium sp. ES2775-CONJ]MCS4490813.1 Rv2175c family DNA-binding protein [Corynebacterium sp. ES2715-CONJ3]MCS4531304.1 Rv2175c family DNA-binding protein [Corynebacterium sp. ES2730-CONJ]MCU9518673.1 Rv2175c family DNA-binding protein [Corynebacterium sp. ES2794-CONJ1]